MQPDPFNTDGSLQLLAAQYLQGQIRKLLENMAIARLARDVEGVHRSRVASRRLRSGLRLFGQCFTRRTVKTWQTEIKRVTRRLGSARDADVQILFLTDYLQRLQGAKLRKGVQAFLLACQLRRQQAQPRVISTIDRFGRSGVPKAIADTTARAIELHEGNTDLGSDAVYALGRRAVAGELLDLLELAPCLDNRQEIADHHRMRIAAKHLRYTMEAIAPAYPDLLRTPIKSARRLQTLLGNVHDCDVWIEVLEGFIGGDTKHAGPSVILAGAMRSLKPGLAHLKTSHARRRARLFRKAGTTWKGLRSSNVWRDLIVTLDTQARVPSAGRQRRNLCSYIRSALAEEPS